MGEGSFVRVAYEWLANEMQTMLWLGIVLFILLCHKKVDVVCLFAATGFVGGFMFHMVWEVAPRYAITYVVLLIPYAVIGFVECAKWLDGKWRMAWGKLIRS
jgi:predicted neutral ceramidase superfamily lipid hydrolase